MTIDHLVKRLSPPALYDAGKRIGKSEATVHSRNFRRLSALVYHGGGEIEIFGHKVYIPERSGAEFVYAAYFCAEQMRFLSSHPAPVIIDCGSHIGLSVLYWKRLYPTSQVTAVEPDPTYVEVLRRNVGSLPDVCIIHGAVAAESGTARFATRGGISGRLTDLCDVPTPSMVDVPTVSLRALLDVPRVDLLKIDIEGAEGGVLEDARDCLRSVERLFVEYHSFASRPQKLHRMLDLLSHVGFRVYVSSEEISPRPFVEIRISDEMDMRLNIFAWRPDRK